jgi:hypothetical protein
VQNLQQPKGQHWNRGIVMTTSNTPRKGTAALHILYQTRVFRLYDVVCNRWGRTNPPVWCSALVGEVKNSWWMTSQYAK